MKEYIKGQYRKSIFTGENGFTIGIFKIKETNCEELKIFIDKTITFTGYFADINTDDMYIFYGEPIDHPKYGFQYQVTEYERVKPEDKEGIVQFLCSDLFHGVGEKMASAIVDRLGETALEQILENPSCLDLVPKLSYKKAKHIYDTLVKYEESHKTIVYLTELGFTMKDALTIYNTYYERTITNIESNIYKLLNDIEVLSFQKIDSIARNMGIDLDNEYRIKACILHCIEDMIYKKGDTYVTFTEIKDSTETYLNFEIEEVDYHTYLDDLRWNSYIVLEDDKYYLKSIWDAENNIVKKISILNRIGHKTLKKIDEHIHTLEELNQIQYGDKQREAIKMALSNNISIITGGPGTGKTTMIKAIVDIYLDMHSISIDSASDKIALLAPTGRASKRMSESTLFAASTIHRFLRWNKETNQFGINEYNKSTCKLIIIDEFSMIDIILLDNLFKGLSDDAQIVIVGDYHQLPSVGPGQVLKDLIESDTIPMITLDLLYRQSEDSYITTLAYDMQNKKVDDSFLTTKSDYAFLSCSSDLIRPSIEKLALQLQEKEYSYKQVQFMAPMYAGVNGIDELNKILQKIFNPSDDMKKEVRYGDVIFRENDKVLQLVNMPDDNVFNGDIGVIDYIIPAVNSKSKKTEVYVNFDGNVVKYESKDLNKIKHGFIVSIHKSQGSEFDLVVIPICMSYYRMLYRKLIYTGITRAKKKLILLGELKAFMYAVNNETEYIRKTTLCNKLKKVMYNLEESK